MPGQADSYPFLREKTLRRKITALGIFAMPAGRGVGRVVLSALEFIDDHAADLLAREEHAAEDGSHPVRAKGSVRAHAGDPR